MKVWFIKIQGKEEGPYSTSQLKVHPGFNPDTLVRRKGDTEWRPARKIPELKHVFQDEKGKRDKETAKENYSEFDEVIALEKDPNLWLIWLLIVMIVLSYVYFKLG